MVAPPVWAERAKFPAERPGHERRGSQFRTRRYDAVAIRHSVGGKVAVTANHAGVLRSGHNADTDSAVAIADNLLKHHDILLLPTMNQIRLLFTRKELLHVAVNAFGMAIDRERTEQNLTAAGVPSRSRHRMLVTAPRRSNTNSDQS
jgi:hypothetical protein